MQKPKFVSPFSISHILGHSPAAASEPAPAKQVEEQEATKHVIQSKEQLDLLLGIATNPVDSVEASTNRPNEAASPQAQQPKAKQNTEVSPSENISPCSVECDTSSDDEDGGDDGDKERRKKTRTVFSRNQVCQLESMFDMKRYLSSSERTGIARDLGLSEQQIKIWFQNRRNKLKRQIKTGLEMAGNISAGTVPPPNVNAALLGSFSSQQPSHHSQMLPFPSPTSMYHQLPGSTPNLSLKVDSNPASNFPHLNFPAPNRTMAPSASQAATVSHTQGTPFSARPSQQNQPADLFSFHNFSMMRSLSGLV